MTYFEPIQPVLGVSAVALALFSLKRRTVALEQGCAVPPRPATAPSRRREPRAPGPQGGKLGIETLPRTSGGICVTVTGDPRKENRTATQPAGRWFRRT